MADIPVYVYIVFVGLVWLGLRYCRPRIVSIPRLALMPALMTYAGVRGYWGLFAAPGALDAACASIGAMLGLMIGWRHASGWTVAVDRGARSLRVPGDPLMLVIILLIFLFEFALHYGADAGAAWFASPATAPLAAALWSVFICMSIGRNLNLAHQYFSSRPAPGNAQ